MKSGANPSPFAVLSFSNWKQYSSTAELLEQVFQSSDGEVRVRSQGLPAFRTLLHHIYISHFKVPTSRITLHGSHFYFILNSLWSYIFRTRFISPICTYSSQLKKKYEKYEQ